MAEPESTQRLTRLEEHAAFTEHTVEQLSSEIAELHKRMAELTRKLGRLEERLGKALDQLDTDSSQRQSD